MDKPETKRECTTELKIQIMERKINLSGSITASGNPIICGLERFNEFFKAHPNKTFNMQIEAHDKGTTDSHVWYIMKMILPAYVKGMQEKGHLKTTKTAYYDILETCPMFYKSEKEIEQIFDWNRFEPSCKMQPFELEVAIEWLHIFCLENFGIVIGAKKSI